MSLFGNDCSSVLLALAKAPLPLLLERIDALMAEEAVPLRMDALRLLDQGRYQPRAGPQVLPRWAKAHW